MAEIESKLSEKDDWKYYELIELVRELQPLVETMKQSILDITNNG